jgi:hypothetical protein
MFAIDGRHPAAFEQSRSRSHDHAAKPLPTGIAQGAGPHRRTLEAACGDSVMPREPIGGSGGGPIGARTNSEQ